MEEGPEAALKDRPRPGKAPKLSDKQAIHLIAVACSDAPDGHNHWTLRLLADKVVELNYADSCSYETIRQLLKKHADTWQKQEWCIPEVSSDFVAAMEDVLDLYEELYDPMRPVVCFDESPKQLIADIYPQASVIRVVLDNLNTHKIGPSTRPFQPNRRTI